MLRIKQIEIPLEEKSEDNILKKISKKLNVKQEEISNLIIHKESIDARHKQNIKFVYEVDFNIKNEEKYLNIKNVFLKPNEEYKFEIKGNKKLNNPIIVVGFGPSGMLASYMLLKNGYKVIIIERGKKVEDRINDVYDFFKTGILNTNSNVQFGEGGAGTFSDGKLNTLVKDSSYREKMIFDLFVECGAPKEILYEFKPHIGTDILIEVIKNIRKKILSLGGIIYYETCLTDINIENNRIKSIEVNNSKKIKTDVLILALGHSARDTFYMLNNKLKMEPKPFAVGVRIMHPQDMIDLSQYGNSSLKKASYKLTYQTKNRGVYTFCMCPGGYVVNASSELSSLAINGMSNYKRDSGISNSAVIVTVTPNDFGFNTLDGIEFQRDLEKKAYLLSNGKIPIQLYKDFKKNISSTNIGKFSPAIKGNYSLTNVRSIFPSYISDALIEGIDNFGTKIKGFDRDDAIIAGVESRTSSPVRIIRDSNFESSILGIYPIGEGAGYAGGIVSAAIDGVKVFEAIASVYKV